MPELPEVEVVRAGLATVLEHARVAGVEVRDPRSLKRHVLVTGMEPVLDFERRLIGATFSTPVRRGKFMWVPILSRTLDGPSEAFLAHLGMSGQMLLRSHDAPDDRHVRVRLWIEHPVHGELRLDFADQRIFGSLALDRLVPTSDGRPGGHGSPLSVVPYQVRRIARDPLDPALDDRAFLAALRGRRTAVKRALLDQGLVSGIGNIYADEALWRARVHPETPAESLSARKAGALLAGVREVFAQALEEGGTSFDTQYVNVNGEAGYFARSLHAYGRTGEPCHRCGTPVKRMVIGGRSSHFCPRCQLRR